MSPACVTVHYPARSGRIVRRTELDWSVDIEPDVADPATGQSHFTIPAARSVLAFKPLLRHADSVRWAQGENCHWFGGGDVVHVYPYFKPEARARITEPLVVDATNGPRSHRVRVFTPSGYDENPLERLPVVYLHDGPNVFVAGESFSGTDWRIGETLTTLAAMQAVRRAIAVAVYPNDRMADYTRPGYREYGRFLADDLVPWIDSRYRTLRGPQHRLVMGSSLGGVVSLYLGLEHGGVFGNVACLSSTFGFRDDLARRIAGEPRRAIRIYLDSGWPDDNYEVTRAMHDLLARRGYRDGVDLHYLAFPHAIHHEGAWSARAHIPLQYCLGGAPRAEAFPRSSAGAAAAVA